MSENQSPEVAVRFREITKSYATAAIHTSALRGVDLDLHCGELLSVVGPSGCGKTTLISILAAMLDPDAGLCELFGRNPIRMSGEERSRLVRA